VKGALSHSGVYAPWGAPAGVAWPLSTKRGSSARGASWRVKVIDRYLADYQEIVAPVSSRGALGTRLRHPNLTAVVSGRTYRRVPVCRHGVRRGR